MKILAILLCLCVTLSVYSQIDPEQNLRALANLSPYSAGAQGFDNRYEGIRGNPLLFENWNNGQAQFTKQDTLSIPFQFNIDLVKQVLLVQLRDGSTGQIGATNVKKLYATDNNRKEHRWMVLSEKEVEGINSVRLKFYETLHEGKYQLLKSTEKILRKSDYKGAYTADRRYDEFITETSYWLRGDGKNYKKIKIKRKEIESMLPETALQIAKEKKLDLNNEQNVVQLLEFLEATER